MRRRDLLVTGLLISPGPARAQPRDAAPPFAEAWRETIQPGEVWAPNVSVPLPLEWPTPDSALVQYAFAWRMRPTLADGVEVTEPYARAVEWPDGTVRVERLTPRFVLRGIQGVRPLREEEVALARRVTELPALLRAPASARRDADLRAITCFWTRVQGVQAAAIMPRHPAYAAWLGCR